MEIFEGNVESFRGSNDKRVGYHDKAGLIVETLDVGLFGGIEPDNYLDKRSKFPYLDNKSFWSDILGGMLYQGVNIELQEFNIIEWMPSNPGRYFTPEAKERREYAQKFVGNTSMEYAPLGKLEMIFGGIGSVRLAPRFVKGGEVLYLGATSNGISHQGIPIIVPLDDASKLVQIINVHGSCKASIDGTLWSLPYDKSPLDFDRGIPKYYLFAKRISVLGIGDNKALLTTVAITYNSTYERSTIEVNGKKINLSKNWSFVSFNPSKGEKAVEGAVDWLKNYVTRYDGNNESILAEFDETIKHFENPIEFNLKDLLNGKYDKKLLRFYGSKLDIKIIEELIMGDKFENIQNSTIINRSTISSVGSNPLENNREGNESPNLKSQFRNLIGEGKTEKCIELLIEHFKTTKNKEAIDSAIMQSASYTKVTQQIHRGTIENESANLSIAKINNALLYLIDKEI